MDEDRETVMEGIKHAVEQGRYRVDERAVAEAIVRHIRAMAEANAERPRPLGSMTIRANGH